MTIKLVGCACGLIGSLLVIYLIAKIDGRLK